MPGVLDPILISDIFASQNWILMKLKPIKSSSPAVLAALWTVLGPHGDDDDDFIVDDDDDDDDFILVETCIDPCGPNTVQRAASTATDDDFIF